MLYRSLLRIYHEGVPATRVSTGFLDVFRPKGVLKLNRMAPVPPSQLASYFLRKFPYVRGNPRKIMDLYQEYIRRDDHPAYSFLIRTLNELAYSFSPHSFFATADKQQLIDHKIFKCLIYDLIERKHLIRIRDLPEIFMDLATLEYRPWQLLPTLFDRLEAGQKAGLVYTLEALVSLLTSLATLNVGIPTKVPEDNRFGASDRISKDYSQVFGELLTDLSQRLNHPDLDGLLLCQAAFAMAMANQYDFQPTGQDYLLPRLLDRGCQALDAQNLGPAGYSQFHVYQVLYGADVEKPACEHLIKQAIPFKLQERLHLRWVNEVLLKAQLVQGTEKLQKDVDAALQRTKTQALLNCSVGRDHDEQHCWFTGHLVSGRLCLEYDYLLPLGPGLNRNKPSGWVSWKARLFTKMGYQVVLIHRTAWQPLADDQKDEQILAILAAALNN